MYVSSSAKGRLIQGLARLGSLAARGATAAMQQRRMQRAKAEAVAEMAAGVDFGEWTPIDEAPAEVGSCTPCEQERRRLEAEAARFMSGR